MICNDGALTLVKLLKLDIEPMFDGDEGEWQVSVWDYDQNRRIHITRDTNLNDAIELCAAKVRKK